MFSQGQEEDEKDRKLFHDGEYYFLFEDYQAALNKYLQIDDTANANVQYRIGLCYLNLTENLNRAIKFLKKASKNTSYLYREGIFAIKNAPVHVYGFLGDAYRMNMQYEEALESYEKYKESLILSNSFRVVETERLITSCKNGQTILRIPVNVFIENMGKNVNSKFEDYNPVLSADGNIMVFTRKMPKKRDDEDVDIEDYREFIFYSKKSGNDWAEPVEITKDIGSDGYFSTVSMSHDGKKMLLYDGNGDIYMSEFDGEKWSKAKKLDKKISSNKWESHACFSPDGNTIYFTSVRANSTGGFDIYKSTINEEGEWGDPVNLGNKINSTFNEAAPFITEDGKHLYFASQGHYNMGGFDIFCCTLNEDGKWGEPVNLGYPINTSGDDVFYAPVSNGAKFYTFGKKYNFYKEADIYQVSIQTREGFTSPEIAGKIVTPDNKTLKKEDVTITITRNIKVGTKDSTIVLTTFSPELKNNQFKYNLEPGGYTLKCKVKGYKETEQEIYLPMVISEAFRFEIKPEPAN